MAKERDCCPSCRKKWVNHYGVIHICKRLKIATKALREIQKMCLFLTPGKTMDAEHVFRLIEKTKAKLKQ